MTVAAEKVTPDFELILVNDGSPDNSLDIALEERARDPRIKVVDLAINIGHHHAIMAGLRASIGDRVYLTDCDMEVTPEALIDFYVEWKRLEIGSGAAGIDVIYGIQMERQGPWLRRVLGGLFYPLFNWMAGAQIPKNQVIERLMSRRFVDALVLMQERTFNIGGLMSITGFRQEPFLVAKSYKGSTVYSLHRRLALFIDSITAFSSKPLWGIFWMGLIFFSVSISYSLWLLIENFFLHDIGVSGWTSVMVSMWVIGGFVLMSIGIVGIYLSKVFIEVKQRPLSVIRAAYGWEDVEKVFGPK